MIIPKFLYKGDKIAIVAPAGKVKREVVNAAANMLESWGLQVVIGESLFDDHFQYAATDEKRLKDFQGALNNEEIKAILCARGGYGVVRIVDQLDFSKFSKHPKWIIGFSDITILHAHIHTQFGIETLHATMAAGLEDKTSTETLRKALFGEAIAYELRSHPLSRFGSAEGIVIGGNLAILCSLIGSKSDIDTAGKILFIEDIGEYLYRLDRMMLQLKRAGKLENLVGLIVGGMTDMLDNKDPFGKTAYEIIAETVKEYDYPVCFDFPAGHQEDNRSLIFGRKAILSINESTSVNFEL